MMPMMLQMEGHSVAWAMVVVVALSPGLALGQYPAMLLEDVAMLQQA
jgi:hypothetical protein